MQGLKVKKENANKAKEYLSQNDLYNKDFRIIKLDSELIYPIIKLSDSHRKELLKIGQIIDVEFESNIRDRNFADEVKKILTEDELKHLKTSFDTVGTIAILEIDYELKQKENDIANLLLETNKTIKTVLNKLGIHEGEFRTQKMEFLAGVNTKETIYSENGVRLKVNVEEVYFSPRLSNERKRIMQQVKANEEILVMFSGAAPYPCVLSKNTDAKSILGIEINPQGHKFGLENIKLNKLKNIELINADVRLAIPHIHKQFDRIVMPLPKTADEFLDCALKVSKKGTIIHLYDFLNENEFEIAKNKIKQACELEKKQYKIIELVKCGQHAPRVFRICIDFEILS